MGGDRNIAAGEDFASTIDARRDVIRVTSRVLGDRAVHDLISGHVRALGRGAPRSLVHS